MVSATNIVQYHTFLWILFLSLLWLQLSLTFCKFIVPSIHLSVFATSSYFILSPVYHSQDRHVAGSKWSYFWWVKVFRVAHLEDHFPARDGQLTNNMPCPGQTDIWAWRHMDRTKLPVQKMPLTFTTPLAGTVGRRVSLRKERDMVALGLSIVSFILFYPGR